jgi:NCAIR mutase (PurE)-related protein
MADQLDDILSQVASGQIDPDAASQQLRQMLHQDLGFATLDHDRLRRCGTPEVVYGLNKKPDQVLGIANSLIERNGYALITRATPETSEAVQQHFDAIEGDGRTILIGSPPDATGSSIPIVTAGTSDQPIALEAALTCRAMGQAAHLLTDVGVAGLGRLLARLQSLDHTGVIICIAGMEGALPSVVGGLVDVPILAVPTSVGYGANFEGLSALLGMLNSCAAGVSVLNIDNGFGAAYSATLIQRSYDGTHRQETST